MEHNLIIYLVTYSLPLIHVSRQGWLAPYPFETFILYRHSVNIVLPLTED